MPSVRVPLYGRTDDWRLLNKVPGRGYAVTAYDLNRYVFFASTYLLRGSIQFVPSETGGARPDWERSYVEEKTDYGKWMLSPSCRNHEIVLDYYRRGLSTEDRLMVYASRIVAAYLCRTDEILSRSEILGVDEDHDIRCDFSVAACHDTFLDWRVAVEGRDAMQLTMSSMGILLPSVECMYEPPERPNRAKIPCGMQITYQPADPAFVKVDSPAIHVARLRCRRAIANAEILSSLRPPVPIRGQEGEPVVLPSPPGDRGRFYEITRKAALYRRLTG